MSQTPSDPNEEHGSDTAWTAPLRPDKGDPASERTDDWTGVASKLDQPENGPGVDQPSARAEPTFDTLEPSPTQRESDHSQSLRSKLVLALALMLGVVVGIDEIVRQKVIAPEFANLERVAALKDTNRVLSAINTEVEFLSETASQDISRLGIHLQNAFVDARFEHGSTESLPGMHSYGDRVEWSAIISKECRWRWLTKPSLPWSELSTTRPSDQPDSRQELDFSGICERISASGSEDVNTLRGMTRGSDGQLYLFAAVPLPESDVADAEITPQHVKTFYVVGRRFGDAVMSDLQNRTSVLFSVDPLNSGSELRRSIEISASDQTLLCVTWPLLSPSGQPIAELNVQLPREVTTRSNRTTAFARYLSLCGACVSLLLLLLLLQRIVIGRLETIREHTERIAQTGIFSEESDSPVLQIGGHDEIGQLAKSFDRMRTRLGDAQRRLSDASHAAGMSLVADTVIHNVGNVLTNVNSLIETATRRVETLRIEPLEKLADRLRQDDVDEALQKATPDYLQRLSKSLESDKDELANLLQTLNDNIQHIHQVIRDQRRHANQPIDWVQLDARHVIEEAVKCSQARLSKDNVVVEFNCESEERCWTDRSLILQILINIITNARNAMRELEVRQPKLTIDLIRTKSTVHIRFRDNGCGMSRDTLSRVFDAHFTTRQTGSGLGLHFCAIAIKRIGGSIHAESDGVGKGATFIVDLPVNKPSSEKSMVAFEGPSAEIDRLNESSHHRG